MTLKQKIAFMKLGDAGRLGNQLWQIASTVGIARRENGIPMFKHWDYRPFFSFPGEFWPEHNRTTFSDADVISSDEERFVPHMDERCRVYLQDYNLWSDLADEVREWVQPSPKAREALDRSLESMPDLSDVVSLHVRRGDNVHHPEGLHPLASMRYYRTAVNRFPDDQLFLVFSDDIPWCKENLPKELERDLMFVTGSQSRPPEHLNYHQVGPVDWPDLHLMAQCKGGSIIANSTYSWWGAFASGNDQVYYPDAWFGYKLHKDEQGWIDPSLMFPDHWIELHNPAVGAHKTGSN